MRVETYAHTSVGGERGADVGDVESGRIEWANVGVDREQELTFSLLQYTWPISQYIIAKKIKQLHFCSFTAHFPE